MNRRSAAEDAGTALRSPLGLSAAFVGLGSTGAVIPASLPWFVDRLAADRADVLLAVPMLFTGLLLGVLLAGALSGQVGLTRLLAAGVALQAAALGAVAGTSAAIGVVAGAGVAGVGFGLVESAGIGLARRVHGEAAGQALTRLTALVALTAMAVPLLVVGTGMVGSVRTVIALSTVPHLLSLVLLVRAGRIGLPAPADVPGLVPRSPPARSAVLAPAAALFCYVGAESVVAGWSAELPRRLVDVDPTIAALGTSAFWGLLWLGRAVSLTALRRGASERRVLLRAQAAAVALLTLAAFCAPGAPALSTVLLAASVPALAPSYGLLLSIGLREAGPAAARASAVLVAVGALGGSSLTFLANRVAAWSGGDGVAAALAMAAAAAALSLAVVGLASPVARTPAERRQEAAK